MARGFGAANEKSSVRVSGLFQFSNIVFYSINPRADQMQTPLVATKLDPDIRRNYAFQSAARALAESHFPATVAPDVLSAVGFDPDTVLQAQLRSSIA